jgi:putative ABC transport system substrate-binding protein
MAIVIGRRKFISALGSVAFAWPLAARAQQSEKMLRIGTANVQPRSAPQWVAFERRMADLGYLEGKNFNYDHVQISSTDAWEAGYRQVVGRNPDIVVAAGPELSLKSALTAADKLPIVMIAVDYDPIARGYVTSLARPTGNVTGIYFQNVELAGKHLQLMKQAFPNVTTAIVFWDRLSADYWAALQAGARQIGVRLVGIEFHERPYDYEGAIAGVAPNDLKFLFAVASPFFFFDRAILAEFALRHRMASLSTARQAVDAGSLMSYGANLNDMWVRAANYVDKIAKGAGPADLPIEQPTKFELIINAKAARALGVTIPPGVLAIADEVIE